MTNPNVKLTLPSTAASHGLRATARVQLYTDHAARIWTGGPAVRLKDGRLSEAPCLLQAFAALRGVYNATGNNNPFAEAALVRLEDGIAEVRSACQQRISTVSELLADRAAEGVETPLVTSEQRHTFELTFGTPYHYVLADSIALWDKAVRHLITVSLTGLLSAAQVREAITELKKPLLSALHHLVRDAFALRRFKGYAVSRQALGENSSEAIEFAMEWVKREHTPVTSHIMDLTRRPMHRRANGWKPRS